MRRYILFGWLLVTLIGVAGCGMAATPEMEESEQAYGESVEEMEGEVDPAASSGSDASEIKEIPVEVEGELEMRRAQFNRSGLGYSIYVLEDYQLVSEEPQRDVIFSKFDESYFIRIIVHGAEVDSTMIKNNIIDHAEGEIEEVEVPLSHVEFALHQKVSINAEETSIKHVAKRFNGQLIEFTLFLPVKEPIEGMEPSMWAMLKTVDY
jgi:hypothetical protein